MVVKPPRSEAVFIDSMGGEFAGRFLAVAASRAVKGSVFGVVEGAFARSYRHVTAGLGTRRRIPDGDPPRIALETSSHRWSSFAFARFRLRGRALSAFVLAHLFSARASHPRIGGPCADSSDAWAERAAGRDRAKRPVRAGAAC